MPEEKNEFEKFLEGVTGEVPALEEPALEQKQEEEAEEPAKPNRAQRRAVENASIRQQLQQEREARIAAETRAQVLAEMKSGDKLDDRLVKLYGDSENGRLAAQLHAEMLSDVRKQAVEEAEAKFSQREEAATAEQRQAETQIDDELANLEETYDVDLTSNTTAANKLRGQLLDLVERFSPKDREGTIVEYADFGSAFEMLQQTNKPVTNPRAKDFADRSLQKSNTAANVTKEEDDATRSWLRRNGIRV